MFRCLTELAPDGHFVRRPTPLSEICEAADADQSEVEAVIDEFRAEGRSFVMPPLGEKLTAESVIDISHESLIRQWHRLKEWVQDEADSAATYRRLLGRAREEDYLRPPRLDLDLQWRERQKPTAAWARRYDPQYVDSTPQSRERAKKNFELVKRFLDKSDEEEQKRQRKEEKHREELARTEARAAEQVRTATRFRLLSAALVLLLVAAAAAAVLAWKQGIKLKECLASETAFLNIQRGLKCCQQGEIDFGVVWFLRVVNTVPEDHEAASSARNLAGGWGELLGYRLDHRDVVAAAFSPDGRAIVTASRDGTAQLWDAATRQRRGQARRHQSPLSSVAFSPDGKTVLTGSEDGTAWLWDAETGKPLLETPLEHNGERVLAVAFPPGDPHKEGAEKKRATFLTATLQTIRVWDKSGTLLSELPHEERVNAVAFSPDGKSVLSGSDDGIARIWEVSTKDASKACKQLRGHEGAVVSVAFSPCGKMVLTGSVDATARLWDAETGETLGEALKHDDPVLVVAFSPDSKTLEGTSPDDKHPEGKRPDGKTLATGSIDRTARLWVVWDAERVVTLERTLEHGGPVRAVAFSADGKTLITGSADGRARMWDVDTGTQTTMPFVHEGPVNSVSFGRDASSILTTSENGKARLCSAVARRRPVHTTSPIDPTLITSITFTSHGKELVTIEDRMVRFWQILSDASGATLRREEREIRLEGDAWVSSAAVAANGKVIVTSSPGDAGNREELLLWHVLEDGSATPLSFPQKAEVTAVALSSEGKRVLTGGGDGAWRLWDAGGELLMEQETYGSEIHAVAFSPDRTLLLTASEDGTVQLWSVASGERVGSSMRQQGAITAAAFSSDGKTILTGGADNTLRLWDARTQEPIGEPLTHGSQVKAVAFSAEKSIAVVADYDEIWIWDVPPPIPQNAEAARQWIAQRLSPGHRQDLLQVDPKLAEYYPEVFGESRED